MFKFLNFFKKIKVDKYYKMKDHELELEANKYNIGEYYDGFKILRSQIIKQLIEKDLANNSQFAVLISVLSLFISLASIYLAIKK